MDSSRISRPERLVKSRLGTNHLGPYKNKLVEDGLFGMEPFGIEPFGIEPFGNDPFGRGPIVGAPFGDELFEDEPLGNAPSVNEQFERERAVLEQEHSGKSRSVMGWGKRRVAVSRPDWGTVRGRRQVILGATEEARLVAI